MGVNRIDGQIRSVCPIAEDAIADVERGRMGGDRPLLGSRVRHREGRTRGIGDTHVENVLRELVQGIPARRGTAHMQLERACRQVREGHVHLHPPVLRLGKGQTVRNGGLTVDGRRDDEKQQQRCSGTKLCHDRV